MGAGKAKCRADFLVADFLHLWQFEYYQRRCADGVRNIAGGNLAIVCFVGVLLAMVHSTG